MTAVIQVETDCMVITVNSNGPVEHKFHSDRDFLDGLNEVVEAKIPVYCGSSVDFPEETTTKQWILDLCKLLRG